MSLLNRPSLPSALLLGAIAIGVAGCGGSISNPFSTSFEPAPLPPNTPTLPPAFPPQDIVGRWGLAAYHKNEDRPRTEAAAADQCKQPYIIILGTSGGVMMHLADQATPTELRLKGAPGNKTYIGPADDAPGSQQDREVVSFDGRVLVLRWMDTEVQGRYGTMVYVRCGPEGEKRPKPKAAKPSAKLSAKPKPAPKPIQPPIQQIPPTR
jgi:hypothetical protein